MKIFIFDLTNLSDEKIIQAKQVLSYSEKERLKNMISVKRQKEFILGHFLLRQQLSKILKTPISQINVDSLPSGALFLPDFPDCFASISHSCNFLAIAICEKPVGVDIEKMKERDNFNELLNQIEAFDKAKELSVQGLTLSASFYHFWTRKEALYKLKSLAPVIKPVFYYYTYQDFMLCVASDITADEPEWIASFVEM